MMSTPRIARFRLVLRPRPRLPPVTTAVLCVSDPIDLLTMEVLLSFVPLCFPSWFCGAAFCCFGEPPIPPDAPVTIALFVEVLMIQKYAVLIIRKMHCWNTCYARRAF